MGSSRKLTGSCFLILVTIGVASANFEQFNPNRPGQQNVPEQDAVVEGLGRDQKCDGTKETDLTCFTAGKPPRGKNTRNCVCTGWFQKCCPNSNPTTTTKRPDTTTNKPTNPPATEANHPLDPLTSDEIKATKDIIEMDTTLTKAAETRFIYNWITLKEPEKSLLLPYFLNNEDPPKGTIPRKSFAVMLKRGTDEVYEAVVNLDTRQVESFTRILGVQPQYSPEEIFRAEEIVRSNATIAQRCAALGYPNMSLVNCDVWSPGYSKDTPQYEGKRLMIIYLYGKNSDNDNQYAHPFDFIVWVDLTINKVIEVQELPTHDDFDLGKNGNTVPREEHNYDYQLRGGKDFLRRDDKPIKVENPEGVSYKVTGNQIEWQKWKMRLSFNGREGCILNLVGYQDGKKWRPLLYRASINEMFIPYGDPRDPYYRKAVFDMGEYGIGYNTDQQNLNEDALGTVHFINAFLSNSTGGSVAYPKVISIREEDAGILWKHVDYRTGKGIVTRSHRLVISFIVTVTNYEYIFSWEFYQDGSIQLKIQMSGILSVNLFAKGSNPGPWGAIVAPQINAQYHQHFFATRLDVEIDGNKNSVVTADVVSDPDPTKSPKNKYGQGFHSEKTLLKTAGEGRTKIKPESARVWVIQNPESIHPYTKKPVGWKLMPMNTPPLMMKEDSPLREKATFLAYDFWVIPYKENQLYPGGFYVNGTGIKDWVDQDPGANIDNTDIVVFHMFGLTHIPRVEDYPIMPVEQTGFGFKPYNFFDENPSIDVPPPSVLQRKRSSEL